MRAIATEHAPTPVGPYSQAIASGELIFTAGQLGIDPASGELLQGEIEDEVSQALRNLAAVLAAGDSALARVLRTSVYVSDLSLFQRINAVYARFFPDSPQPARSTVEVAALPLGARFEIDAIATRG
ncbi:MAG: Rid family detoxifying hydrolase [Myxococcota bacterium]